MSERDKVIEEAKAFMVDYDMFNDPQEAIADFALAYHAKQNAENEKLAKLEGFLNRLRYVDWRGGEIRNRGPLLGFALYDDSGSVSKYRRKRK